MPQPTTADVVRRACTILSARGWANHFSTSDQSTLNIRSAVSRAVTELAGAGPGRNWRNHYIGAVQAIQAHLKAGIMDWESRVKSPSEVEAMLTEVANRLEARAARNG